MYVAPSTLRRQYRQPYGSLNRPLRRTSLYIDVNLSFSWRESTVRFSGRQPDKRGRRISRLTVGPGTDSTCAEDKMSRPDSGDWCDKKAAPSPGPPVVEAGRARLRQPAAAFRRPPPFTTFSGASPAPSSGSRNPTIPPPKSSTSSPRALSTAGPRWAKNRCETRGSRSQPGQTCQAQGPRGRDLTPRIVGAESARLPSP